MLKINILILMGYFMTSINIFVHDEPHDKNKKIRDYFSSAYKKIT